MKSFYHGSGAKEDKKQQKRLFQRKVPQLPDSLDALGFLSSSSSTPAQIHLALPHGGINH